MRKKLTITIAEDVYNGLCRQVGLRRISAFIEQVVRPYVLPHEMDQAYADMAREEAREREALEWAECLVRDAAVDPR